MPLDDEKKLDPQPSREDAETTLTYAVADLLRGRREAILVHNGSEYRLRITANGRLILTK
jgi:hemin uptake protein HemP